MPHNGLLQRAALFRTRPPMTPPSMLKGMRNGRGAFALARSCFARTSAEVASKMPWRMTRFALPASSLSSRDKSGATSSASHNQRRRQHDGLVCGRMASSIALPCATRKLAFTVSRNCSYEAQQSQPHPKHSRSPASAKSSHNACAWSRALGEMPSERGSCGLDAWPCIAFRRAVRTNQKSLTTLCCQMPGRAHAKASPTKAPLITRTGPL